MKTYLVGGAVRDLLMGVEPKDRDYVVTGATEQDMLDQGFKKVHAPFPVFLHPKTKNEYALARREKKTGTGYLGFTSEYSPDVTLEEDLSRRDLTINSMAIEEPEVIGGVNFMKPLIDLFGGAQDLKDKVLRHTSNAFAEDPVRVLRVARFMARFGFEWKVAPETACLMTKMAEDGVLKELTKERVWKEFSRALAERRPDVFFDTLTDTGTIHKIFPAIPEEGLRESTLWSMRMTPADLDVRFAIIAQDTRVNVKTLCSTMSVPTKTRHIVEKLERYPFDHVSTMNAVEFEEMFTNLNISKDNNIWRVMKEVALAFGHNRNIVHDVQLIIEEMKEVTFEKVFPNAEEAQKLHKGDWTSWIKEGMKAARIKAYKIYT